MAKAGNHRVDVPSRPSGATVATGSNRGLLDPRTSELPKDASTRRKGRGLRRPPAEAVPLLRAFAGASKRRAVPFPIGFVRDEDAEDRPPLARILRGGQGGEVRLKLLLSMHLRGVRGEHDVTKAPVSWARMLGLPDQARNGARRVRDGIAWLADQRFIRVEQVRGREPTCYLLSPLGTGEAYARPVPGERYIRMPVAFWMNGWIVSLSGTALAMWLILAELLGGKDEPQFVVPYVARRRYRLSEDTFTKGISELERHGLVTVRKVPQGGDYYERMRNTYWLEYGRLDEEPSHLR